MRTAILVAAALSTLQSCFPPAVKVTMTSTDGANSIDGFYSYNHDMCTIGFSSVPAANTGVVAQDGNGDVQEENSSIVSGTVAGGNYDANTETITLISDGGTGSGWMAQIDPPTDK